MKEHEGMNVFKIHRKEKGKYVNTGTRMHLTDAIFLVMAGYGGIGFKRGGISHR